MTSPHWRGFSQGDKMPGIVGLLAFDKVWNVSKFLYYSMVGLQHRATPQVEW